MIRCNAVCECCWVTKIWSRSWMPCWRAFCRLAGRGIFLSFRRRRTIPLLNGVRRFQTSLMNVRLFVIFTWPDHSNYRSSFTSGSYEEIRLLQSNASGIGRRIHTQWQFVTRLYLLAWRADRGCFAHPDFAFLVKVKLRPSTSGSREILRHSTFHVMSIFLFLRFSLWWSSRVDILEDHDIDLSVELIHAFVLSSLISFGSCKVAGPQSHGISRSSTANLQIGLRKRVGRGLLFWKLDNLPFGFIPGFCREVCRSCSLQNREPRGTVANLRYSLWLSTFSPILEFPSCHF